MSVEASRPFLSRLDATDGRVPYEVLARWCRYSKYNGEIKPGNYDEMLDAYQQGHRRLSYAEIVQQSVLDNIEQILNATHMPQSVFDESKLAPGSLVSRSVLNFGVPPYVGGYDYRIHTAEFSEGVRNALITYEPRLDPGSVRVHIETDNKEHPLAGEIRFIIEGNITELDQGNHMELETVVMPFKAPEIDRSKEIFQ